MARSGISRSTRYYSSRTTVVYSWPDPILLGWRFIMYGTGGVVLGISAAFYIVQETLQLGIPWLFPYGIVVGALTIVHLFLMEYMLLQRALLPGIVMLGSFVLFVLYIAGMVETAIQLFGSPSNINNNCNTYVFDMPSSGVSLDTFAFISQRSICQSWDAYFAFWLVGVVWLAYAVVLASQVNRRFYN